MKNYIFTYLQFDPVDGVAFCIKSMFVWETSKMGPTPNFGSWKMLLSVCLTLSKSFFRFEFIFKKGNDLIPILLEQQELKPFKKKSTVRTTLLINMVFWSEWCVWNDSAKYSLQGFVGFLVWDALTHVSLLNILGFLF